MIHEGTSSISDILTLLMIVCATGIPCWQSTGTVRAQDYELKGTTLKLSHGWHGALSRTTASMQSHHRSDSTIIHHVAHARLGTHSRELPCNIT